MTQPLNTSLTATQRQALTAFEAGAEALMERLNTRIGTMLGDALRSHGGAFSQALETLVRESLGNAMEGGRGPARGGFSLSPLQRAADLWQELQRARRNL